MIRVSVLSALMAGGLLSAATMSTPQSFRLPLAFEQNRGQAPPQVKWMGQGSSYRVLLGGDGATFLLPDKNDVRAMAGRRPVPLDRSFRMKYSVMRMKLAGGQPWTNISGVEPTGGVSNYLSPTDLKSWISNVPHHARVRIAGVYKGIDLMFYSQGGDLEYDFVVAPGADPKQIQVVFEGMDHMRVDEKSGDLVLTSPDGSELRQFKPRVYQQVDNKRVDVAGGYRMLGRGRASFALAAYDRRRELVIDPTVDFTTFFGGNSSDEPAAIAVDRDGLTYVTGSTFSRNFPTTNGTGFQDCMVFDFGGFCFKPDIFVAKLDALGKVVFATYGGVGGGAGIAVDSTGVYITGENMPADGDNIIFSNNLNGDIFVWRLNLNGQGGQNGYFKVFASDQTEFGTAIALDSNHMPWIAAATYSSSASSSGNIMIFNLFPDGGFRHEFDFASDGEDVPLAIAIDPSDRPWITGKTCGDGFPTTDGILHRFSHCAVFVLQLESSGSQRMGMVFGGADGDDVGVGIATNGSDDAYVTGYANSSSFPTTPGAFQTTRATPGTQGFVTQVDSATFQGRIIHSTFLSSDGSTKPFAIANNDGRGVFVAGSTSSSHMPNGPFLTPDPTAGFVTKFSVDLAQVRYTQLLGLVVSGVALRKIVPDAPEIYTTGWRYTGGHDFDHEDAFVVKLEDNSPTSAITNLPAQVFSESFTLMWAGSSPVSTVTTYDVFVSDNGGPFTPFQTATTATSATFTGVTGHTYGFFSIATDAAGNKEPMKTTADIVVKVVDGTPPAITPQITGTLGSNGWYRSAVTVNWSVSDPQSGIASSTGCAPTNLTEDTAGVTLTCSAINGAGLATSVPITIKIDKTLPVISGMPAAGCSLWPPNHKLVQVATLTATDALSGLGPGSLTVSGTSNEPSSDPNDPEIVVTPNGPGGFTVQLQADRLGSGNGRVYTLNATAMDNAGNSATATAKCTVPHDKGAN